MTVRLTVLVENTVTRRGLLAEHGFSIWVETDGATVLFDAGQGLAIGHNVAALDVPLERACAVALSHGHYDHAGGLAAIGSRLERAPLFAHPDAFRRRYSIKPEGAVEAGASPPSLELRSVREPTQLAPGVSVTGEIPRETGFEDTGGPFFLDPDGSVPDPIVDDQALVLETRRGHVVVLGCGHAGVINTLRHVERTMGIMHVHAVVGGMHLRQASGERVQRTADALAERHVERVVPGHCTGAQATRALVARLGSRVELAPVGSRLRFD